MPIFDELMKRKPLDVPDERVPEELRRGEETYNTKAPKVKNTSVSVDHYFTVMRVAAIVGTLVAVALVGYVIYSGVTAFITG